MKETKKIFKFWFGWNIEKVEKWLEKKGEKGWDLVSIGFAGLWFTFEKVEQLKKTYSIDFQMSPKDDYFQLYKDAGWELVSKGSGWYYWSQEYEGQKPESFTDIDSLVERLRRQIRFLAIIWVIQIPNYLFITRRIREGSGTFYKTIFVIILVFLILMTTAMIKFIWETNKLKRKKDGISGS